MLIAAKSSARYTLTPCFNQLTRLILPTLTTTRSVVGRFELTAWTSALARTPASLSPLSTSVSTPDGTSRLTPLHIAVANVLPGEGCAYDDIDVSPSAFDKLADKAKGRVNVEWSWA